MKQTYLKKNSKLYRLYILATFLFIFSTQYRNTVFHTTRQLTPVLALFATRTRLVHEHAVARRIRVGTRLQQRARYGRAARIYALISTARVWLGRRYETLWIERRLSEKKRWIEVDERRAVWTRLPVSVHWRVRTTLSLALTPGTPLDTCNDCSIFARTNRWFLNFIFFFTFLANTKYPSGSLASTFTRWRGSNGASQVISGHCLPAHGLAGQLFFKK